MAGDPSDEPPSPADGIVVSGAALVSRPVELLLKWSSEAFSEAVAASLQDGRLTDEEAEDVERRRAQLDAELVRLLGRAAP